MQYKLDLLVLFLILAVLLPASGFFDAYLLPWQSRLIFTEHPNLWIAAKRAHVFVLPFSTYGALPYGPLFYYPMGLWVFLLDGLQLIDLRAWDNFGVAPSSMRYTALLKLPNLFVYLATAMVAAAMVPATRRFDAVRLWLLNPAVIVVTFVMGQNDGWSMLTVLLALLLATRCLEGQRYVAVGSRRLRADALSMVVLGIGGAIKLQPLFFVVPFAIALGRSDLERLLLAVVSAAVFGALIAPFVSDPFFREHALFHSQSTDLLRYEIGKLPLFYPAYVLAALIPLTRKGLASGLVATVVAVHLLVFALADWNPERSVWFLGALLIPATDRRLALTAYVLVTVHVFVRWIDFAVGAIVFSVVSPELAHGRWLDNALNRVWDYEVIERLLWGVALVAFTVALGDLLLRRAGQYRMPRLLPIAVLLLLPAYFGAAIAYGDSYSVRFSEPPRPSIFGPAVISQPLLESGPGLTRIDVAVEGMPPSSATLVSDDGTVKIDADIRQAPDGVVALDFARIPHEAGPTYVLVMDISVNTRVFTASLPGAAPLSVDGRVFDDTVISHRQYYERDWGAAWRDPAARVRDEWVAVSAITVLLALMLAGTWHVLSSTRAAPA